MIEPVREAAGFRDNPFRIVPPAEMNDVIWAGDTTTVNELMEATRSPRADALGTSELVVLWGEYGSGKTNALKFVAKQMRQEGSLVAYTASPSVADKPAWHDVARNLFTQAFHKEDVAERLAGLRRYVMVEASNRARAELGDAAEANPDALNALRTIKIRAVAREVLPEAPGFVEFAIDLAHDRKDKNWSYLADKPTGALGAEIASKYNLPPDGLSTDHGATLLLSSLIRTITHPTPFGVGSDVVCIFMDEVEDLQDLLPASRLSILQGIRDLFNTCTEHLVLALAATASDASEMWGILDTPLMQRLSRQLIQFAPMEASDAKAFILDVMAHHRVQGYDLAPAFPFSADGLEAFVQACPPPITPRKLLVSAGRLVFQKRADQVRLGQAIEPDDVYDFNAWGGN